MDNHPTKRLVGIREAALYLDISHKTLYNRTAPKSKNPLPIKVKRIGKLVKFDLKDLEAYVDSL